MNVRAMRAADLIELLALAALWGASFLFMRLGASEFGPVALAGVRVAGAALLLVPLLQLRGQFGELRRHWRPIFLVGVTNSALPFLCFGYAALSITAGLASIFNAATPLFGAAVAWLWWRERLPPLRLAGLAIGFAGVSWLVLSKTGGAASFKAGGSGWAIVACLAATLLYGISANYTQQRLSGVAPLAVAAGSQLAATLVLVLPAWWWWPAVAPTAQAWAVASLLALLCTGVAYLLFFRLIAHVGPANAITVTFLIPVFAVLWGGLWLGESVTPAMTIGCFVIVLGTALSTGWLERLFTARAERAHR
jgi:drug/metabolite transporter (DMT)-like permease